MMLVLLSKPPVFLGSVSSYSTIYATCSDQYQELLIVSCLLSVSQSWHFSYYLVTLDDNLLHENWKIILGFSRSGLQKETQFWWRLFTFEPFFWVFAIKNCAVSCFFPAALFFPQSGMAWAVVKIKVASLRYSWSFPSHATERIWQCRFQVLKESW